jgi:predicted dehydrogenase
LSVKNAIVDDTPLHTSPRRPPRLRLLRAHVPRAAHSSDAGLAVVNSSRPDAVHADLPGVPVVTSAEAAIVSDIDVVVIATPNVTHAPLAMASLDAGRHVVVDKPFMLTLDEARAAVARAHEKGLVLTVFQNRRWDSDFLASAASRSSSRISTAIVRHFAIDGASTARAPVCGSISVRIWWIRRCSCLACQIW